MNSSFNQESGNNPQEDFQYPYLIDRPTSAPPSLEYIQNTFGDDTLLMTPGIRGLPEYERFYASVSSNDPSLPVPFSHIESMMGNPQAPGYSLFGNVCIENVGIFLPYQRIQVGEFQFFKPNRMNFILLYPPTV